MSLLVSDTDILVTIFVHARAKDLSSPMLHCVTVSHITWCWLGSNEPYLMRYYGSYGWLNILCQFTDGVSFIIIVSITIHFLCQLVWHSHNSRLISHHYYDILYHTIIKAMITQDRVLLQLMQQTRHWAASPDPLGSINNQVTTNQFLALSCPVSWSTRRH